MGTVEAMMNTPILGTPAAPSPATSSGSRDPVVADQPQLLSNLASLRRTVSESVVSHYNVQPVFEVYANVQGRDLGAVSADVNRVVDAVRPDLPRGSTIAIRGQVESMNSSFAGLAFGLVFAVLLVYFLIVVNFQSWLDPFIILTALPGALAGILWMLFLTQTTLSVPALMGAIMCIGVATANSILMITFANDQRREGLDARAAALSAGSTRLRPVMMTALAMIVGMLPMSLGVGEGGEQNAPLGRAVIGGLLVATFFTLVFVPVLYTVLRCKPPAFGTSDDEEEAEPSAGSSFDRIDEEPHAASEAESVDDRMLVSASGPLTSREE
jgi:multidrug efflux pump subunit AcrB